MIADGQQGAGALIILNGQIEAEDGTVVLRTRRGKRQRVRVTDSNLQRASLWQRLIHRARFPQLGTDANGKRP